MTGRYQELYDRSMTHSEEFWAEAAQQLSWYKKWDRVLDDSNAPFYRWFSGGEVNTCFNALDRHIEDGRGDQAALIYDSPVTSTVETFTYTRLRDEVARLAGALQARGVTKGDRVIIYMPMIPQAAMAMLACARIGAIHSVVFGGFAANELATRFNDAKPKLVMAASCGVEGSRVIEYKPLLDRAIERADHKPESVLLFQRSQCEAPMQDGRDYDWLVECAKAAPADCVPVAAADPLYILYTSGTTGQPKGVVRDNGGHMVALHWSMKNIYGVEAGDVYWAASDVGWVVGHSYIVYAPLLAGCTTIMYEGKPVGTPDAGAFWRVISQHRVKVLFTAPTAFRAIKRDDPNAKLMGDYDLSCFEALYLAGERSDPDTLQWAEKSLGVPVIDHWWQTETGWPICANPRGVELLPIKYGSPTVAVCGWDVQVVDEGGNRLERGKIGALVAKLPLPPGTLPTLWQNEERFKSSYLEEFPGYYATGDAGFIDEDGYIYVMSRTDDIINVAGHRLSTGGMEEVLSGHQDVAECAVIGVHDDLKGQLPLGFVVLKSGVTRSHDTIIAEIVAMVRDQIGPVAAFKQATIVDRLPKTRSGKILRKTMRSIADGESYNTPATIDDPAILPEIADALKEIGYAK
tara:strand:+ start:32307 stop:34202 length:1896 start_codon:yes stop_codon:yes gene_type:complete